MFRFKILSERSHKQPRPHEAGFGLASASTCRQKFGLGLSLEGLASALSIWPRLTSLHTRSDSATTSYI